MAFTCCIVQTAIENSSRQRSLGGEWLVDWWVYKTDQRAVLQRNNSMGACSTDLESTVDGGECHQIASTETHSVELERFRVLVSIYP